MAYNFRNDGITTWQLTFSIDLNRPDLLLWADGGIFRDFHLTKEGIQGPKDRPKEEPANTPVIRSNNPINVRGGPDAGVGSQFAAESHEVTMGASLLDIRELEGWIEILSQCKPLDEAQIKLLCDKVPSSHGAPFLIACLGPGSLDPGIQCTAC